MKRRRPADLDDLVRRPLPGMEFPTQLEFTHDGRAITFLEPDPGTNVRSLWRLDLESGSRALLAAGGTEAREAMSRNEELRRQRRREAGLGITGYNRAEQADLLVTLHQGGCLVSRDGLPATALPDAKGAQAAYPSPDGARVAWVRDGDVYVTDLGDGGTQRLTTDARPGIFSGLADYLAAEELDRFEGAWWSASGDSIAFARIDERGVPLHATSTDGTEEHRYPFAGGPNPRTQLRIATLEGGWSIRDVDLDFGDGYLARVVPHPAGGWLVGLLPRDQRSLRWHRVRPSGVARQLWVERSKPWINLDHATRILAAGRILRATERTGFRHLELRESDGSRPRQLTEGPWVVSDVVAIDEARGEVLFLATADSVLERHLYVVPLDAPRPVSRPRRLTSESGWHVVVASPTGDRWIDSWSTRSTPTHVVVKSRAGAEDLVLHESSAARDATAMVVPELRVATAADGSTALHVAIFRPARSSASASRTSPGPAVVWVYGGPHSQVVRDSWELTVEPSRQALVRAGFTVVVADNRGTANRGLAFESPIAGQLGAVEIEDQAAVVESLVAGGELDPRGVGISGASYGGFLTVMALERRPDLFVAGVAGAPVVDWTGYDSAYTERYLGRPSANEDAYRRSSGLARARELRGRLLVMHGTRDENVHPWHTLALRDALRDARRRVVILLLPDERHSLRGPEARRRWLTRAAEHFLATLSQPADDDHALPRADRVGVRRLRRGG